MVTLTLDGALFDRCLFVAVLFVCSTSLFSFFSTHRDSFDEETKLKKRAIELNQGRAAQMVSAWKQTSCRTGAHTVCYRESSLLWFTNNWASLSSPDRERSKKKDRVFG